MSTTSLRARRRSRGGASTAPSPRSPVTATGVEIDGASIRVVEVRSGRVVSYRQYVGESIEDTLKAWKPRRRTRKLRISWSYGVQAARTSIPNVPAAIRPLAIADAADAMFPAEGGALMTAGVAAENGSGSETTSATIVAIRREKIAPVSSALRTRGAFDLMPALLTLRADGMYVVLGDQAASVTLIESGVPVAYREMATATPPVWEASLPDNDVNNYLSVLIPEVSATLASWQARGHSMPDRCFVAGPGVAGAGGVLPRALASIGLGTDPLPAPEGITQYDIPASEVAAAYLAIAAAAAPDSQSVRMTDAVAMAEARAGGHRRRRLTVAVGSLASAAILAAAGVVPLILAGDTLSAAANAETAARAQAQSVARWTTIAHRVDTYSADTKAMASATPHYARGLRVLFDTAPSGTVYTSVSTQSSASGLAVTLSASVPGSDFNPIASWVSSLEAAGATDVQAQSFSASHGTTALSMTLDIPTPPTAKKG